MRILNGRSSDDKTGKVTFCNSRGTSLIDYVLIENAFLRSETCNFRVGDFNLYSDHVPIYLTVKTKENNNKQHNIPQTPVVKTTKVLWNPDAIDEIKKRQDHSSPNIIASVEDIDESPEGINIFSAQIFPAQY